MRNLSLILFVAIVATSCGGQVKTPDKPMVVQTAVAKSIAENNERCVSFISQPHHTTDLSFRVSGPIKSFNVYPGNYFKKGDIIAQVDPRDYVIRHERAQGIYRQASAEYERLKTLYEKNNISASTYDRAYADYISAKTAYETARNELADTKLVAPYNGYIDKVFVEEHQDIKATQPIVSIVDIDQIRIEAYITGELVQRTKNAKQIEVRFDEMPQQRFRAQVIDISKSTTSNNLSYLLTALLPNSESALLPGMSGEIVFDSQRADSVIGLPQTALCHRPHEGDYVWIVDRESAKITKRHVTLGSILKDGYVVVNSGVAIGESVAISGLRFLSDGMSVVICQ